MWLRCALYCKSHKFCKMGHRNWDKVKDMLIVENFKQYGLVYEMPGFSRQIGINIIVTF